MLGEVQYGGRVTDDLDKHLLNTFAQVWFSENLFGANFCFYKGYVLPEKSTSVPEILQHVEGLPGVDSPEVFGLHPNADITYQTNLANQTLSTIINIQPKDSGGGAGETRESSVQRLAGEMLEKLPPDYVPHEVRSLLRGRNYARCTWASAEFVDILSGLFHKTMSLEQQWALLFILEGHI
ncbi:hypothetical protein WMY93_032965 [Mugilogobius chulae]|uniref:Dynein heavy chain AAA lid domain-containing protein n=1 Tax=Mugilogobius chulae TaxID=88201 RepID=A0AAW0MUT8_9GOBI